MGKTLSIIDKTFLDDVLGMQNGYVLDFTIASFSNFFGKLGIDIYDNEQYPNKHPISNSKAWRLRAFWDNAPSSEIKKAISGLAEYLDAKRLNGKSDISIEQIEKMREICDKLTMTTKVEFQEIPDGIDEKIKLISTRGASFDSMKVDEKLKELNNLIENLLKINNKYIFFPADKIFFGFLSEKQIKEFRDKTQCFRHASEESLIERREKSDHEKRFLVDLGVFIVVHIHIYRNLIKT
jgi:hypothetical protein